MENSWIVRKYGGTSVSSPELWDAIANRALSASTEHRVWIVASAVSQVSNHLERAIAQALTGDGRDALDWIEARHRRHADELGLSDADRAPAVELFANLERLLEGVGLTGEAPPRLRARILSYGELASTRLGIAALRNRGVDAAWVDARDLLRSEPRRTSQDGARFLDAHVEAAPDPARVEEAIDGARVVLTQGFIARTPRGETCLLGRGGSDTSAALFAVLLDARSLEIWTDVHGMFTADPRRIPTARLIRSIGYRGAQELATMGAKVLHPRCLEPVGRRGIPVRIRNTFDPEAEGTRIARDESSEPAVHAVASRAGVTLVTLKTLAMWGAPGFLARAFAPFEALGISIDLVATSQSAVSVTLDPIEGGVEGEAFQELIARLEALGEVQVVHPCAVVSIVGRGIRTVLHELGPAMAAFREHQVHLVSESSEDLNLSFVVDEEDARPLIRNLHRLLFPPQADSGEDARLGDSWEMLVSGTRTPARPAATPWWVARSESLLDAVADGAPRFAYDLAVVRARASALKRDVPRVGQWFYSMKANPNPAILEAITSEGFGIECVSIDEVTRARAVCGPRTALLFTPNFCPAGEYAAALDLGAEITIDGAEILGQVPDTFRDREVGLRVDPGTGLGHHDKVRTAGPHAKFGLPIADVAALREAADRAGARVVGVHAHVGSGIFDAGAWSRVAEQLLALREILPDLRWVDVGGGLGVVERPGQEPLDLADVGCGMEIVAAAVPGVEFRMEPGRFLVSEAGVLLAPVTQVRRKGGVRFVGVATGMNSLLRPALYGAWHGIHNLSRLEDPPDGYWHVVGPICESGDVLGRDRLLPGTAPGDVLLVENCGAYGAAMASRYNLREPASEVVLPDRSSTPSN